MLDMPQRFDASAARRIGDAVRELERHSSAELVVEIRGRSGSYAHADARFAATFVLLTLVILVFMPWVVPPVAVLLDAVGMYVAGLALASRSFGIRRLFTTRAERLAAVRTHAAALFHQRGVANTSGETGVLLYASLLERRIEVLADRGLLRKVVATDWNAALRDLHEERAIDPDAIVAAIGRLSVILERDAPVGEIDEDELPSEPGVELS
jgi:putative membrane protein